jgi:hypothetical protein
VRAPWKTVNHLVEDARRLAAVVQKIRKVESAQ